MYVSMYVYNFKRPEAINLRESKWVEGYMRAVIGEKGNGK